MLYPLIVYEWQMLLPYDVVEDIIPHNSMLQYIVLADVIAKWQMEWPLYCLWQMLLPVADGIATTGWWWNVNGRCYYQVADGMLTGSELF